jgi:hypothetical protein
MPLPRDKFANRPLAERMAKNPLEKFADPALSGERGREIEQLTNLLLVGEQGAVRRDLRLSQRQAHAFAPHYVAIILEAAAFARALTDDEYLDFVQRFEYMSEYYYKLHLDREARLARDVEKIGETAGDNPAAGDLAIEDEIEELKKILTRIPVRKDRALQFLAAIERDVENADRARWKPPKGKKDPFLHLRDLTAPLFIKQVWGDKIRKGRIFRELIAEYDKDLLQAYDVYVSARRSRGVDLGDAIGLTLVSTRKPRKNLSL